jgi:DNA gyrase subunit A
MATSKGIVKKTELAAYSNPRTSGVIAINLDEDDALIGVSETSGNHHIILGTRHGMAIRFEETQARSLGRVSRGVRGIKLRDNDEVVGMIVTDNDEGTDLLTLCENGYGKRTNLDQYRVQARGGLGLIDVKTTDKTGQVVVIKPVTEGMDLMLITAQGMIIRTGLDDIRTIGRNTQGVRLINLKEGDSLVAAEVIPADDDSDDDNMDQPDMDIEIPTQDGPDTETANES